MADTCSSTDPLADLKSLYLEIGASRACGNNWDNALIWFDRAVSYAPDDVDCRLLLAIALEKAHRFAEAIDAASVIVLAGAPEHVHAHALHIIGRCCVRLDDLAGSVRAWTQLIVLQPDNQDAWRQLVAAGKDLSRREGALRACIESLQAIEA